MFDGSVVEDEEVCDECELVAAVWMLLCTPFGDGVLREADDKLRSTDPSGIPTFRPYPCNSGFISRLFIRFPVIKLYTLS